jgi:hypothetical protein
MSHIPVIRLLHEPGYQATLFIRMPSPPGPDSGTLVSNDRRKRRQIRRRKRQIIKKFRVLPW